MTRPNILLICTDQQRSDSLGCYGNPHVRSPNIDAIAAAGTRFERHLTPMQICSPSRATMISGLYPRHHQLITNGRALPDNVPTLMSLLAASGYNTHGVGKQHLQPILAASELAMPDSRAFWRRPEANDWNGPFYGYQTIDLLLGESDTAQIAGHYASWLRQNFPQSVDLLKPEFADEAPPSDLDEIWRSAMPSKQHYNTWISDCSARFIEQQAGQDDPFFLFVSYPDPHHPFDPPAEYAERYDPEKFDLPQISEVDLASRPPYCTELFPQGPFRESYWSADEGAEAGSMITTDAISETSMRSAIAYTSAMIEMIDDGVGRILDALAAAGLADDSIVIFTSDHGEYLGDHGLLHKGPASYRGLTELSMLMRGPGIGSGQVVDSLSSHIDLVPTLLELTDTPSTGIAFDGLSLAPLLRGDSDSLREHLFGEYHPTVRKELYNQTIYRGQWRYTIYPEMSDWGEMFDLETDPGETRNLFFDDEHADLRRELSGILEREFPPQAQVENRLLCKW